MYYSSIISVLFQTNPGKILIPDDILHINSLHLCYTTYDSICYIFHLNGYY